MTSFFVCPSYGLSENTTCLFVCLFCLLFNTYISWRTCWKFNWNHLSETWFVFMYFVRMALFCAVLYFQISYWFVHVHNIIVVRLGVLLYVYTCISLICSGITLWMTGRTNKPFPISLVVLCTLLAWLYAQVVWGNMNRAHTFFKQQLDITNYPPLKQLVRCDS